MIITFHFAFHIHVENEWRKETCLPYRSFIAAGRKKVHSILVSRFNSWLGRKTVGKHSTIIEAYTEWWTS